MHYVIIEDLESDREELSELIRKDCFSCGEDVHLSSYPDGESFLKDFRAGFCSAVFLDILLGDGKLTGIETALKIREIEPRLPLLFITVEPSYALAGYQVHPLDYLIKPVNPADLNWCMQELREYLAAPAWFEIQISTGLGTSTSPRHIFLDDFLYAETAGSHRLSLHTTRGDVMTRLSLSELAALLPGGGRFYQTGQGTLVNFSQISEILENGEILFKDGHRFFCSRRKIKDTRAAFQRHLSGSLRNTPAAKRFMIQHTKAQAKNTADKK